MTARVVVRVPAYIVHRHMLWRRLMEAVRRHPGPDSLEVRPETFDGVAFMLPDKVDGPSLLPFLSGLLRAVDGADVTYQPAGGSPAGREELVPPPAPSPEAT